MSGVSNMLPFVVGGGILIALAFSFGGIKAEGPLAELFMSIGGGKQVRFIPCTNFSWIYCKFYC